MNQNYLMINQSTGVVENICLWNGDNDIWTPPANTLMLLAAETYATIWAYDSQQEDYVLSRQLGRSSIGFTWNGSECVTNEPKPDKPVQPISSGTQEL